MRHGEDGFPFQIADVRLHFAERRNVVAVDGDPAIAKTAQFVEQKQRVAAVDQHVLVEAEAETPRRGFGGRLGRGRRRRLDRRASLGVGEQFAQVGEDADANDRVGLFRSFDLRANEILGVERDSDQFRIGRGLPFANPIKRALEFVGESGDLLEPEHRARALDRMEGAKRRVDEIVITGSLLEIEQRLFELLEEFRGLLAEDFGGISVFVHPKNFFAAARSCSCLKGLVIQPVAPAALACCFIPSSDSVVRKTIGTPR